MRFDVHDYSDIMFIDKPKSNHKPMEIGQRAAQFSSFAALKGYDDSIDETGRVVEQMIELSNDQQNEISNKLIYLKDHLNEIVEVIYFVPDTRKKGGSYQNKKGTLRIIDEFEKRIQFTDKSYIDISNIYQIRIDELDRKEDLL